MESGFYSRIKKITEDTLFDSHKKTIATIKNRIEEEAKKGHTKLKITLNNNENTPFIMNYFSKEYFDVYELNDNIEDDPSEYPKIEIRWTY